MTTSRKGPGRVSPPSESFVAPAPSPVAKALAYTNRRGDTYYLHQGQTKTGKLHYFIAKSISAGALPKMPPGFEFTESINGVVSVGRTGRAAGLIPAVDLDLVRTEISPYRHLRYHAVEARGE